MKGKPPARFGDRFDEAEQLLRTSESNVVSVRAHVEPARTRPSWV